MGFLKEYKKSLKLIEVEELSDIIIFRPLGYLIMKIFYYTPATPNFLTLISFILGIATGYFFMQTEQVCLYYGIIALFFANGFDCADGQLARAKQNGTKFGRIFDGLIDYFTYISVYFAMAFHLHITTLAGKEYLNPLPEYAWLWWLFVLLAGAATSIQAMLIDAARNDFINYTKGSGENFIKQELGKYRSEYHEVKKEKGRFREKFLYKIYIAYLNVQLNSVPPSEGKIDSKEYYKANRIVMRLWGIIGSSNHLIFVMICAAFDRFDIYVWGILIPYNIYTFIVWSIQKIVNRKLSKPQK